MEKTPSLLPCLSGENIAQQPYLQEYLTQLKSLISAPNTIYQELYLGTLYRLFEFCQAMPFELSQAPYSLIQQQLALAITALKLRRGYKLPRNTDSELIAEQEPLWTYAIFTACLFKHLNRLQKDRLIELYRNENDKLDNWSVLAGSLFEPKTYYKILPPLAIPLIVEPNLFYGLLIGRLIPAIALRWLASQPVVFSSWQETIIGSSLANESAKILLEIIEQAVSKINYPIHNTAINHFQASAIPKITPETLHKTAQTQFLDWITQRIETAQSQNQRISCLRVTNGLLVETFNLHQFVKAYPQYQSMAILVNFLTNILYLENNKPLIVYRHNQYERQEKIEGIIIAEHYLNDRLKVLPVQTNYILDFTLTLETSHDC